MTREQIEELRGIQIAWCGCAPTSGCSAARAQLVWPALLAAAERALLLEDVLAAAKEFRKQEQILCGTPYLARRDLFAAIDRAETS
jgi:hypothetical protein